MDGIKGANNNGGHINLLQQYRFMLEAIREIRGGSGNSKAADTQTTLRYKLDADERGVLSSASPSASHAGVTNQEQTNIRRLSAEAQQRGEEVVSVDVDYTTDIVDGKLSIKAGRTEVVSIPREEREAEVYAANVEATASLKPLNLDDDTILRMLTDI